MPVKKIENIKNKEQYKAHTERGASKEKATHTTHSKNSDYDSKPYEERTRGQLYEVAKELEIEGRSKMDKDQLINAISQLQ